MAPPVVTTTTVTQLQLMLRTTVTKFRAKTLVCSPALSVVNSVNKIILTVISVVFNDSTADMVHNIV